MTNKAIVDQNQFIHLAALFRFVSDFEKKTGYGLSDIYEWLNPDITEPEKDEEGYRWEEASVDYEAFQSRPGKFAKRISVKIADAFFSACENFEIYSGMGNKTIHFNITRPSCAISGPRVFLTDIRAFVERERQRTSISDSIIWKLFPDEIQKKYTFSTYKDALKKDNPQGRTISEELANSIRMTYSQIPGRNQPVDVREGITLPAFSDKQSFSVSADVGLQQLKEKVGQAQREGIYVSRKDFVRHASGLLQADVSRLFDKQHDVFPRLRVAICLALLAGHKIPKNVLDAHRGFFELIKFRNQPVQEIGSLVHEK